MLDDRDILDAHIEAREFGDCEWMNGPDFAYDRWREDRFDVVESDPYDPANTLGGWR
jgi:hypothetical protein